ncbi:MULTISPECIES: single-stranded DNA-binding protein [Thermoanaerobacterium]|uniref:Single-stranded DNA-binding protein n=3 Tax=Thermoanaerobacterium TaxID=28895 RepID=L0IQB1_THETR|nr:MULTISPECIES: single-stranded DNA-binding protein [Thermoanaerobacterium]AFK94360.1 single-strand binding protein [Thermoanaerobacterium saccharolyticum JW/SL-YS485]AGB20396.1 single-stranded DNA-binding protein [Thermoanaerobacterium thermosaccharolyticum M0795]ETO39130.1 single-strand binding protein [Thermoanaerobacterium aotearoense SCUT27]
MLNKVILIGRLTKDPVLRYTQEQVSVCSFTLAVNRDYKLENGERPTDFVQVVAWRKLAEICNNNLKKGRLIAIIGRIQTRSWDDDNGNRHWITEVITEEVKFLDSNKEKGQSTDTEIPFDDNSDFGFNDFESMDDNLPF